MMDLGKVVVTGAGGTIGGYVDFGIKTDRTSLDVTNLAGVRQYLRLRQPQAILHLAGEADVDRSEREPEKTYLLNSIGTYVMARAAQEFDCKLVCVSTSGVFDGESTDPYTATDKPNPINHYGHSKYLGEVAVQGLLKNYLIVRTDWVFGGSKDKDKKLVAKTIAQFSEAEMSGVSDQKGSPTYAKDLVHTIKKLLLEDATGIRHAVNSGSASQYEFMQEIVRIMNGTSVVKPVSAADFRTDAPRWKNKALASDLGMRPWQEALRDYLEFYD